MVRTEDQERAMLMRVISGSCKGTRLKGLSGDQTRPTSDKVKESVFNIAGPYFDGGSVLDLYAGSGGMAIEALSRGLTDAVLIDKHYAAIQVIRENLSRTNMNSFVEVFKNDANKALQVLIKNNRSFDMIILDPPYARQELEKQLDVIADAQLLKAGGVIICEHDKRVSLKDGIGGLYVSKRATYGDTVITMYKWGAEDE
nr:16S rRNA (guanine(966)-N(2))-methyltransferase RsmD [Salisediminibacterium selenitireducens]